MRFPTSVLEEIKARLPVSVIVGRKVRLRKAGKEWKGLSPFNNEKTPSFTVNDQKQFYHCFSTGNHGDIFRFLMETEGLSFHEAVEKLAQEAGIDLPKDSFEDQQAVKKRTGLYDVMELAAEFYTARLMETPQSEVQYYLEQRGLSRSVQERFRLGYAPSGRYALRDYLASKDIPSELMIEAGLLISGENIPVPFDRFRHRLMFPITDMKGRVVAFGARALSADVQPKYLNSPDTPLFDKGKQLYNHAPARKSAFETSNVVVVEGYMDVIALDQAGIPYTVAPLGTALTDSQLQLLWQMVPEPILCFDGDNAGRKAAYRALDLAVPLLKAGISLRFAQLPEGQDPDDILRSSGSNALKRILSSAIPLVDMLWTRELQAGPINTPERRAALEQRLHTQLLSIKDETVRRYYRDDIKSRLEILRQQFHGAAQSYAGSARNMRTGSQRFRPMSQPPGKSFLGGISASANLMRNVVESPREIYLVGMFLYHPFLLASFSEELAGLNFQSASARRVLSKALEYASVSEALTAEELGRFLEQSDLQTDYEKFRQKNREQLGDSSILKEEADPVLVETAFRQALIMYQKASALRRELQDAERALAEELTDANFKWLQDVKQQLSSLEGMAAEQE